MCITYFVAKLEEIIHKWKAFEAEKNQLNDWIINKKSLFNGRDNEKMTIRQRLHAQQVNYVNVLLMLTMHN